jgi:hypothetical protein
LNTRRPKDPGLIIHVPLELARDIFRESGDLQFVKFPATMTLADTIGKDLSTRHKESTRQPKPTILRRNIKTTISLGDLKASSILTR